MRWLKSVDRTDPNRPASDDGAAPAGRWNLIVLTHVPPDDTRYVRKERAPASFGDARDTTAAVDVAPDDLGTVDASDRREQYAAEAQPTRDVHDPGDTI